MEYLPINIDIKNKNVLVIGAGEVAARKIKMLLKAKAKITCLSLQFSDEIKQLANKHPIELKQVDLEAAAEQYLAAEYLKSFQLVISATDNGFIAKRVFRLGQEHHILVNTVDQRDLCNYITPAMVDRSPVMIAISSSGSAPVLARNIREKIETLIPHNLGELAAKADSMRDSVIQRFSSFSLRKRFWEKFFKSSYATDVLNRQTLPDEESIINNISKITSQNGSVALVGAGPGDPELLTIKALRHIQEADVVFHDRLISEEILNLVRKDAELISVGKQQGNHSVPQDQINELLIKHAQMGHQVVRLKGGDPFVFGRGGEELQALKKNGVPFSIVPGITAAIGCSAYAGIPLTHRDHAQNVLFITAHCKNSIDTLDWPSLAREQQTLAVYMGLMKSEQLSSQLIGHGKSPETPIAIIENGTTNKQRVIRSQLNHLATSIKNNAIKSPALIIIGEVAALNDDLAWFNTQIENSDNIHQLSKTA